MADVKIQGRADINKLLGKQMTWVTPPTLKEFLTLVRRVIETSKYTDSFIVDADGNALENLRTFVCVKANRIKMHPDLEECIDVAAYAYMVFHKLVEIERRQEREG